MSEQYPQYPKYPESPEGQGPGQAQLPPQPSSISTAVKLMYAGAGLSLLSLVIGLFTLGDLKGEIEKSVRETDPDASQSVIDASYAVSLTLVFLFGLVGVVLWLWMAWKNGQGRSWARITATVLGVLQVLSLLLTFNQPGSTGIAVAFSLLLVVLGLVALFFLWKKESSQYYEAVTRSRQLH